MENRDTISLLKECDSGTKMAVTSIDEVLDLTPMLQPSVMTSAMAESLSFMPIFILVFSQDMPFATGLAQLYRENESGCRLDGLQ